MTADHARRVEEILDQMTIAEMVGQLGSYWGNQDPGAGDVAPQFGDDNASSLTFDRATEHGLGQITRTFGTTPVSVQEGVDDLRAMQKRIVERSRFGIPALAHEECLTGFTAFGATVYPTSLAWGATWNPEIVEEMATAIGSDMHAVGVQQGLAPVLDVVHDLRWGRVEETIGEDPYLVGTVGTGYVKGLEKSGIVATLKHFAGYSASVAARNHAPVQMGKRHLRDVVLPPFEMAVREGGVRSVMNSYTDVDGIPAAGDRWLLTDLLRGEWGFTGTVVSDYFSVAFLHTIHKVAESLGEAAATALSAGLDVELPATHTMDELPALVESGKVDVAIVREAARRVLLQKAEMGLLDEGWEPCPESVEINLDSPRNRDVARRLAEQSIVLVKNNGTLPLARETRIAVIGPSATDPATMMGCYSFPNHVLKKHPGHGLGIEVPAILDALREELTVAGHAQGCEIMSEDTSGFQEAARVAAEADVAVVTVGDIAGMFGRGTSGEGIDVADLKLPGVQEELVEAILATGTPVVLVVVSGRPYALGRIAERCAAIVQAFFPGEEGAGALAGVLSGRVNPSGHLPVGIPVEYSIQPWTYLAPGLGRNNPGATGLNPEALYPFGHGLTYTSFTLSDLTVSAEEVPTDGSVRLSVRVTNDGEREGTEVVQLYLSDEYAQVTRPVRELVGYARVTVPAGESRTVEFDLHTDRTSFTGLEMKRIVEPGAITLSVGTSSEDLPLATRVVLTGETRVIEGARVMTTPVTIA